MKTNLYTIRCLTNMHVGAGEANFSIIDNQVQRDAITQIPMINASSLKGALREHMGESNMTEFIFGSTAKSQESSEGAYKFFDAHLLARPVRSSHKPYFMATSPSVIGSFLERVSLLGIELDHPLKEELEALSKLTPTQRAFIFEDIDGLILEDIQTTPQSKRFTQLGKLLGEDIALMNDDQFKALELPVIARNKLNNGKSENLWYEEIVPRESRFYFFIAKSTHLDEVDKKEKLDKFDASFENSLHNDMIQLGANKSIGYGFSQITKVVS